MKILITCHSYFPKNDGVQFVTQYLAEGLVKRKHTINIVTNMYHDKTDKYEETYNGVSIKRINVKTKHTFHHGDKSNYINYIKNIVNDFDVMINVCTQCATTDWLLKELKNINIPKVLYLHSMWDFKFTSDDFSSIQKIGKKIFSNIRWHMYYIHNKKNFKLYDRVIQLHSRDNAKMFFEKKYGISSFIIENAVDDCFFDVRNTKKFTKPFEKYIIYVANYIPKKNQELAAIKFLNSKIDKKIGMVFIGSTDTNYYHYLNDIIKNERKKLNLQEDEKPIKTLYGIERNKIPDYVANSCLFILTSDIEKFPISIVESMASSIPFLSTDVGIVKYLPGGIVSTSEDLTYWIENLITNEQLSKNLGKTGRDYALEHMNIEKKVEQFEQLLLELINKK